MSGLETPLFVLGSVSLIVLGIVLVVILVMVPLAINLKVDPDRGKPSQPFWHNMGVWVSNLFVLVGFLYGAFLGIMVIVIGATYMSGVLSA